MECKFLTTPCTRFDYTELIDTLWNVNIKYTILNKPLTLELIDTLWNVNVIAAPLTGKKL